MITQQKSNLLKLTKVLMIGALMSLGLKANAQCSASYTFSVSPANDGTVDFTSTSLTGSGPYYIWSFGDGSMGYGATPTHVYSTTGTYTVCLQLMDSLSACSDTICNTISVVNSGSGGSCAASFTPFDSLGYGYFWNTSVGSGLTSTWDFGDGSTGTSTGDITHLYAAPGAYHVCLTISNFFGTCTSSYCDTIHITSSSSGACMGIVNTYFSATDSSSYGVFNNTPSGPGQVYFWDFGDGSNSSTVGSTTHYYSSPGTYNVCLTVYETGGSFDSCQYCSYVTIGGAIGGCDPTFTVIQDSTNVLNYFVYNNSTSSSSTMTYFWDFGDGSSSTLQYPSHTYPSTGPYYLCLTVTETAPALTCTATFCDSINAGHMSGNVTITVVNPSLTGINENTINSSIENYPNPFSGSTTIRYAVSKDAAVELNVVDLLGNKVAELESANKAAGEYSIIWNADQVAEGMYLLQLKVNNQVSTKKIVINK